MSNLNDLNLEGYLNGTIQMPTMESNLGDIITDEEWKKQNEEEKKRKAEEEKKRKAEEAKEENKTEETKEEEPKVIQPAEQRVEDKSEYEIYKDTPEPGENYFTFINSEGKLQIHPDEYDGKYLSDEMIQQIKYEIFQFEGAGHFNSLLETQFVVCYRIFNLEYNQGDLNARLDFAKEQLDSNYNAKAIDMFSKAIDFCLYMRKGFEKINEAFKGLTLSPANVSIEIVKDCIPELDIDTVIKCFPDFFYNYETALNEIIDDISLIPEITDENSLSEYLNDLILKNLPTYLENSKNPVKTFRGFIKQIQVSVVQKYIKDNHLLDRNLHTDDQLTRAQVLKGQTEFEKKNDIRAQLKAYYKQYQWSDWEKGLEEQVDYWYDNYGKREDLWELMDKYFKQRGVWGTEEDILTAPQKTELANLLVDMKQKLGEKISTKDATAEIDNTYLPKYKSFDKIKVGIREEFELEEKILQMKSKMLLKIFLKYKMELNQMIQKLKIICNNF